ncbi:hypothetical protein ACWCPQ_28650 [Nocardia sp. NPDC001965]
MRRGLLGAGVPEWAAAGLLRSFEYARLEPPVPSSAVRTLTGHPARTYGEWVTDHLELFR